MLRTISYGLGRCSESPANTGSLEGWRPSIIGIGTPLIPTRADHHALDALAQSRRPMDMMIQGWSMRRVHAPEELSAVLRGEADTGVEQQVSCRECPKVVAGLNLRGRGRRRTSARVSGTT